MSRIKTKEKNFAEARIKKNGLTVQELSDLSNVNRAIISRTENGKTSPNPRAAKALCEALGVEFDDIFEII